MHEVWTGMNLIGWAVCELILGERSTYWASCDGLASHLHGV